MTLTAKDVEEIVRLIEASPFTRLSLEMDGLKLELDRGTGSPRPAPAPSPAPALAAAPAAPPPPPAPSPVPEGLVEIRSPLLGIFYRAPKPGEPPFVDVGGTVTAESVIGIVEVMKLMNSARAGIAGEVVEILVADGDMVEHGQPLMRVRPA